MGPIWVLDEATTHKVKRIEVNAGERLSYQYQYPHSEVWTLISGLVRITMDGVVHNYKVGDTAIIHQSVKHRIETPLAIPLIFIEIQHGNCFSEDDVLRVLNNYQST